MVFKKSCTNVILPVIFCLIFMVSMAFGEDISSPKRYSKEELQKWRMENREVGWFPAQEACPVFDLQIVPKETFAELGIESYGGQWKGRAAAPIVPVRADLLKYMPPAASQSYDDCTTFALAHYGVSYWYFHERGIVPSKDIAKRGNSLYLYNQINGGKNRPISVLYSLIVANINGCSLSHFFFPESLDILPDNSVQYYALPQRLDEPTFIYHTRNWLAKINEAAPGSNPVTTEEIEWIKENIASGVPVIVVLFVYQSFRSLIKGCPSDYVYSPSLMDNVYLGNHAVVIAGYFDDDSIPGGGAFLIRNSWGGSWGAEGDLWISYDFLKDHSVSAYPVNDRRYYSPTSYIVLSIRHPWRGDMDVTAKINGCEIVRYSPNLYDSDDNRNNLEVTLDVSDHVRSFFDEIELLLINTGEHGSGVVREAYLVRNGRRSDFYFSGGRFIGRGETVAGIVDETAGCYPVDVPQKPEPVAIDTSEEPLIPIAGKGGGGGCDIGQRAALIFLMVPLVLYLMLNYWRNLH